MGPDNGDAVFNSLVDLGDSTADNINEKLRLSAKIAEFAGCDPHLAWIDVPNPPSAGEAMNMWIKVPKALDPVTLKEVMPIKQWVDICANTRYAAHVFCPPEHRVAVNKAAIDVLGQADEYGLSFLKEATDYAKID